MAIKELRPAKSKFRIKNRYIVLAVVFIIITVASFGCKIYNDQVIRGYEKQIAEVQQKVDNLNKENEENLAVINSTDRSAYYAKKAREVYGYGKPGEYVFYKAES